MSLARSLAALSMVSLIACAAETGDGFYQDPADIDEAFPPTMEEINISSSGSNMNGLFYTASGEGPHPTVVLLHAFPGYEKNLDLAQALRRDGVNILFFHYRGIWGSEGAFTWENGFDDARRAIAFLKEQGADSALRVDPTRISLIGHSYGAVAALAVGAEHEDIVCIASLAPEDLTIGIEDPEIRLSVVRYTDNLKSVPSITGEQLADDLTANKDEWAMTALAEKIGDKPFLLIGGALDQWFDGSEIRKTADAARKAGATNIIDDVIEEADHSFSARRGELIGKTVRWHRQFCR